MKFNVEKVKSYSTVLEALNDMDLNAMSCKNNTTIHLLNFSLLYLKGLVHVSIKQDCS